MKKYYFLLFFFTTITNAQNVNIPDANFKAKLLQADPSNFIAYGIGGNIKIDANNDGEIQVSEAQNVYGLFVYESSISDLTGILSFTNLYELHFSYNQLQSVSLNGLTNLEILICENNQLTSLDINSLINLKFLNCDDNQITSLDVNSLINLEGLTCSSNQLSILEVNNLINLTDLGCSYNQLSNLEISNLTNLTSLECFANQLTSINLNSLNLELLICGGNQLTSLDISNQTELRLLACNNNQLPNLDVSNLTFLESLYCQDNILTSLFIKNGAFETEIEIFPNPNLQFVCADELQIEYIQNLITAFGASESVMVNSYCSFTPGGNYNTITGKVTFDANNNGCDVNDVVLPFIKMNINDGTTNGSSFLNNSGNYSFYTQEGNFTVNPVIENPTWFTVSPISTTVSFNDNLNNTNTQDFCIIPNGFHPDIEVVISPIMSARPGFDAQYLITYKNNGNYTFTEGLLNFQYNDAVLDYVATSQSTFSQSEGNLSWLYTNLLPFESRSLTVTLNVNSPMETPAVNIDDLLSFTAFSYPSEVDENSQDNAFEYIETVIGSFDPNDKTCLEGNAVSETRIGEYLHYNIRFENTGTAAAQNIVVKDEIDGAKFDISTFQVLNTSHPAVTKITGNKVEFIFENINLPFNDANNDGYVVFKIKTKSNLAIGSSVSNKANIYFDYNFPIETNLETTTFQLLSTTAFETDDSIIVYPNPTKNQITVNANNTIKSMQLFDIQGRIINTSLINDTKSNLDISTYSNGIYFLKVTTGKGIKTQKISKE